MKKKCHSCLETKDASEFHVMRAAKDGLQHRCKECTRIRNAKYKSENKERNKALGRKWRSTNREKISEYIVNRRFKIMPISEDEFNARLEEIGYRCEICNVMFSTRIKMGPDSQAATVDHCHESGEFRGILCSACNTGIGHLKDNVENLMKAADYLMRSKNVLV